MDKIKFLTKCKKIFDARRNDPLPDQQKTFENYLNGPDGITLYTIDRRVGIHFKNDELAHMFFNTFDCAFGEFKLDRTCEECVVLNELFMFAADICGSDDDAVSLNVECYDSKIELETKNFTIFFATRSESDL